MKPIALISMAALLGACSTTSPSSESASVNAAGEYIVVQDGTTHTLETVSNATSNGVSIDLLRVGAAGAGTAYGFSNADVTAVGGQADGTFITGLSGTQTVGLPTSGTLDLTGRFGFYDGSAQESGEMNLTANFGAGTFAGSGTFGSSVSGTISGTNITGTFNRLGSTGTLNGGFYGSAAAPTMAATITGANLAGILVVN